MKPDLDSRIEALFSKQSPDEEVDWQCKQDVLQLLTDCLRYAKPTTAKALKEFKDKARELGLRI